MQACSIHSEAERSFGRFGARELMTTIADLEAFDNAAELIAFLDHNAEIVGENELAITVGSNVMSLVPVGAGFEKNDSGSVGWVTVSNLKLMSIKGLK